MATNGWHWKWWNFTLTEAILEIPSEQIEKQFGTIDHITDLNELYKFGLDQIYGDWGTH